MAAKIVPFTVSTFSFYLTPTGIKSTHRAKVQPPREVLKPLTKSDRRRVRKALSNAGRVDLVRASL